MSKVNNNHHHESAETELSLSQTLELFFDKASDDLRDPLSSIFLSAELLMSQQDDINKKRVLTTIMEAAAKIETTINRFPGVAPAKLRQSAI